MIQNIRRSNFFTSNKARYRFARTVAQAACGFVVDNASMIMASTAFDATTQALIVSGTMAVLSPVMHALGMNDEKARDRNAQ